MYNTKALYTPKRRLRLPFPSDFMIPSGIGHGESENSLGLGWIYYAMARSLPVKNVLCIGSAFGFAPAVFGLALKHNGSGTVHFVDASYDYEIDGVKSYAGCGYWHEVGEGPFHELGLNNVKLTISTTQNYTWTDDLIDILFIDGDHSFAGVKHDFDKFASFANYVLLHDSSWLADGSKVAYGDPRDDGLSSPLKKGSDPLRASAFQVTNDPLQRDRPLFQQTARTETRSEERNPMIPSVREFLTTLDWTQQVEIPIDSGLTIIDNRKKRMTTSANKNQSYTEVKHPNVIDVKPRIFVVSVIKDEADIIGPWCDHYASLGVERILILDGSRDATVEILAAKQREYPNLFQLSRDDNPAHRQDLKITRLCEMATDLGATFILPVDGDEFWRPVHGTLTEFVAAAPNAIRRVQQVFYSPTYLDDDREQNPTLRLRGHGAPTLKDAKICFKWRTGATVDMGNHSIVLPEIGQTFGCLTNDLLISHYPYRSEDQFVSKVRKGISGLAAAPELDDACCRHWRARGKILLEQGEESLRNYYRTEIYHDASRIEALVFDNKNPLRELCVLSHLSE